MASSTLIPFHCTYPPLAPSSTPIRGSRPDCGSPFLSLPSTNYVLALTAPIELLSPARTAEVGMEAILHGADAVYIGGPAYGARSAAANSIDDIARLCSFAHSYGARVYVTLNTIIYDHELAEAERLIWQVYRAGADALIVQDLGLLRLHLPP